MLCEKCGTNIATTHIHTVINGISKEIYLCPKCAAKQGYSGADSFAEMLFGMLGEESDSHKARVKKCVTCGTTFADISKSGKVGCADCYETFLGELLPYIKRVHGSTQHVFKEPFNTSTSINSIENKIQDLRAKLSLLISEEKYEEAAVIRDEIRALEEKNNG